MNHSQIGVIIVTYKTPAIAVHRLQNEVQRKLKALCFVVDNSLKNKGFAHAANRGILLAQAKGCTLFILCNPDIYNIRCSINEINAAARHFDVFGGVMKQDKKSYYGGVIDYWTMAGGLQSKKPVQTYQSCDFVSGSFMCFTKKALATIGYLPEHYFMYYEDVDYCHRAKENNLSVGITTKITYSHEEWSKSHTAKIYYLARNRLIFLFAQGSLIKKVRELLRIPFTVSRLLITRSPANSLQLQGYRDFLYGKKIPHQF